VRKSKQLASIALAVMTLAGTSAFAESRHSNETRRGGEGRSTVRRERSASGSRITVEGRRGDVSRNRSRSEAPRTYERRERTNRSEGRTFERRETARDTRRETARRDTRRDDRRYTDTQRYRSDRRGTRYESQQRYRSDRNRNDSRYRGGDSRHGNRQAYSTRGRISRCERWGSGYRVWVGGAPYPFYVPLSYWHRDRFRVGLYISLGGYYNPLGYYDYWDGYRDGSYNSGYRGLSRADFRGVVETVDYRRDSFVVRNEDTGDYITVVLRDRDERLPREGDFVAVRGDWTTQGYFRAYDVDFLDRY
jgi:hypothetical protein